MGQCLGQATSTSGAGGARPPRPACGCGRRACPRIRETCTLAVFSAMNSAAPIWRLVAPCATSASTWRSRGVRPNGSSGRRARSRYGRPLGRQRRLERAAAPADERRQLVGQPPRSEPLARPSSAAPAASAAAVAVAGLDLRLGLAPARDRRRVGALDRVPVARRGAPQRRRRCARARARAPPSRPPARPARPGRPPAPPPSSAAAWIRARATASRSLGSLAQVARALGDVGLDASAGGGHAGDPHHVVGAQLEPVERVLDRRPRPGQVVLAAQQLRQQRAEPADPLRLGRARDDGSASSSRRSRDARRSPSPSATSASSSRRKIARPVQPGRWRPHRGARAPLPVAGLERQLGDGQHQPFVQAGHRGAGPPRAPRARSRAPPPCARQARACRRGSRRRSPRLSRSSLSRAICDRAAQQRDALVDVARARSRPSRACSGPRPRRARSRAVAGGRERRFAVARSRRGSARAGTGVRASHASSERALARSPPRPAASPARAGRSRPPRARGSSAHWTRASRASSRGVAPRSASGSSSSSARLEQHLARDRGRRRRECAAAASASRSTWSSGIAAPASGDPRPQLERAFGEIGRLAVGVDVARSERGPDRRRAARPAGRRPPRSGRRSPPPARALALVAVGASRPRAPAPAPGAARRARRGADRRTSASRSSAWRNAKPAVVAGHQHLLGDRFAQRRVERCRSMPGHLGDHRLVEPAADGDRAGGALRVSPTGARSAA